MILLYGRCNTTCPEVSALSTYSLAAGVFYCGEETQPIVILAATYNTIAGNLQNCPVDCENSAASSNSTTFYWQVSAWTSCSTSCDGGVQTRDVICHSAVDGR